MPQKDDTIGPWSEDKLALLRKYLTAYVTIMRKQAWCRGYHYVDAFAGSGQPRSRDMGVYVDGSPRVALGLDHPFTSYTFIEQDPYRVGSLQALQEEFTDRTIHISEGDCNIILQEQITLRIHKESFMRGMIFVDPFAMTVDWETIQAIARTEALEIFMNIPTMAINRTALLRDFVQITNAHIERMNRFWGTNEWRADLYHRVSTLFGEWEIKVDKTSAKRLGDLYRERLQQVFSHVTYPLVMRNSRNIPIYCLIYAGHNKTGKKITTDIFKRYERLGA